MNRLFLVTAVIFSLVLLGDPNANGRGFGGGGRSFSGGGGRSFSGGGSVSGSANRSADGGYGHGSSSFSGSNDRGGSYSGSRSGTTQSTANARGGKSSYDRSWESASGATVNTSGTRGAVQTRGGGVAAGGTRDTTVTTASGKTYSADRQGGVASGPRGNTVGGASGTVNGRYGTSSWNTAFAGNRYGTMDHYSSVSAATASGTRYWSNSYTTAHGTAIRANYAYANCFQPAWYTAHPGCWYAAGVAAGAAYAAPTYSDVSSYCEIPPDTAPANYDYGSNVVIDDDSVTVDGADQGTPQQFAEQATTLASAGQTATAPPTDDWKPLGVFALVQGDEKDSNNIFQLAVNKDGIIRGNYYDGLMDTTTEVFGSLDKKSQRAAWTIGKKKDRVFEAGISNLTKSECPCLIHLGTTKTSQMLLVRVDAPKPAK